MDGKEFGGRGIPALTPGLKSSHVLCVMPCKGDQRVSNPLQYPLGIELSKVALTLPFSTEMGTSLPYSSKAGPASSLLT